MELESARGQRGASRIPGTWIPRGAVKQVLYHPGSLVLEDGGWNRRLRIDKNVSAGSVIWHPGSRPVEQVEPGEAERFLCIGAAGYRPGGLILAPGERMRLSLAAGLQPGGRSVVLVEGIAGRHQAFLDPPQVRLEVHAAAQGPSVASTSSTVSWTIREVIGM